MAKKEPNAPMIIISFSFDHNSSCYVTAKLWFTNWAANKVCVPESHKVTAEQVYVLLYRQSCKQAATSYHQLSGSNRPDLSHMIVCPSARPGNGTHYRNTQETLASSQKIRSRRTSIAEIAGTG